MIKRFFTHSLGGGVYENPEGQYVRFADHEAAISEAHDDADSLLRRLNLDPERYRTEAGFLNVPKIVAAIKHPDEYPRTTNQPTVCIDWRTGLKDAFVLLAEAAPDEDLTSAESWLDRCDKWLDTYPPSKVNADPTEAVK